MAPSPSTLARASTPSGADTLALFEAIYDLDGQPDEWLRGVAQACAVHLDEGVGVEAYFFDFANAEFSEPLLVGGTEEWQRCWRSNWWDTFMVPLDPDSRRAMHSMGACMYSVELWDTLASGLPTYRDFLASLAQRGYGHTLGKYVRDGMEPRGDTLIYPDSWNLIAVNPGGLGCALAANRIVAAVAPAPPEQRLFWERIVGHMTSAIRLRSRVAPSDVLDGAEMIVDPCRGKIEHASAPLGAATARLESLRDSMVAIHRLAGADASGEEAVATWRALHEGGFSIMDTFDKDGRRYFVAHENAPRPTRANLAPRERQVADLLALGHSNKFIAYELGLAPSTVAALLARAARKLGAKSRAELVRLARTGNPESKKP